MVMIKKIHRQSVLVLIPLSIFSALIEWKKLPLSILIGGVLALANLKGLAWGVEGLIGAKGATAMLIFFSLIRFIIIIAILIILFRLKLLNVFGIFVGFTVVLILLLKEGLKSAKNEK
ncbi:MAG: ATP synthase subunit I [Nitrospirae bacterium]|nr:ATP synthase subunit I [Nitrospirota bacterium]